MFVGIDFTSPTPVTLDAFLARADGAGVLVEWHVVSEFQNLGFNVYKRSIGADDWSKVNASLIQGRITNADAKTYHLYDWAGAGGAYEYKLETVSLDGRKETFAELAGPVAGGGATALSPEGLDDVLASSRTGARR